MRVKTRIVTEECQLLVLSLVEEDAPLETAFGHIMILVVRTRPPYK